MARTVFLDSSFISHQDKEWGLTDCVSFVLMKQEGVQEVLTANVHFQQAGFTALLLESDERSVCPRFLWRKIE